MRTRHKNATKYNKLARLLIFMNIQQMYVYVYIHICMLTYLYICTHTHTYIFKYTHGSMYLHMIISVQANVLEDNGKTATTYIINIIIIKNNKISTLRRAPGPSSQANVFFFFFSLMPFAIRRCIAIAVIGNAAIVAFLLLLLLLCFMCAHSVAEGDKAAKQTNC